MSTLTSTRKGELFFFFFFFTIQQGRVQDWTCGLLMEASAPEAEAGWGVTGDTRCIKLRSSFGSDLGKKVFLIF